MSLSGVGCGVLGALTGVGANKEPPPHSGAPCGKTKLLFGFKGSIDSLTAANSLERDRDTTDGAFVGVGAISRLTLSPVSTRIFFAGGWIGAFSNGWLPGIGGERSRHRGLATLSSLSGGGGLLTAVGFGGTGSIFATPPPL